MFLGNSEEGRMEQAKGILLLGINAKYIHTNLALYSLRQYAIKAAGM